jgi:predicted glycosyltransferase
MNELLEYLRVVEMKLQDLIQDVRNIRERLESKSANEQRATTRNVTTTFFNALQADDDNNNQANNGTYGC